MRFWTQNATFTRRRLMRQKMRLENPWDVIRALGMQSHTRKTGVISGIGCLPSYRNQGPIKADVLIFFSRFPALQFHDHDRWVGCLISATWSPLGHYRCFSFFRAAIQVALRRESIAGCVRFWDCACCLNRLVLAVGKILRASAYAFPQTRLVLVVKSTR